jgi:nucleoside-diphosphate-sugar epimerase
VEELLKKNQQVLIYDKNLSTVFPELCIIGDVRDREKLTESMQGVDLVYHLAAEHRDDVRPRSLYYDVNVGGAESLVFALNKNNVNKVIFTSSVAVYGLNIKEATENSPLNPFNDYSHSKHKSELVFKNWANTDRENCLLIVRPTVIFGEGNKGNVYNLIKQIESGRFLFVGNGKNTKSMGYVKNISCFLTSLINAGPGVHLYNYADKPDLTTAELVRLTQSSLGKNSTFDFRIPYWLGLLAGHAFDFLARMTGNSFSISAVRIKKFCSDSRISTENLKETGFTPPCTLVEGLKRMIKKEFPKDL